MAGGLNGVETNGGASMTVFGLLSRGGSCFKDTNLKHQYILGISGGPKKLPAKVNLHSGFQNPALHGAKWFNRSSHGCQVVLWRSVITIDKASEKSVLRFRKPQTPRKSISSCLEVRFRRTNFLHADHACTMCRHAFRESLPDIIS